MKIHIVGGGPAGLYLAILMKRRDPNSQIRVWERNPAGNSFGWGLVFSGKTLANLEEHDAASYEKIAAAFQRWDNVDVVHKGEKISIRGNRFAGIARIALLRILQERCAELGVDVRYEQEVEDLEGLRDCDILVGADGVNSRVRERWADRFRPHVDLRPNRYIWLGTSRLFHGLTLIFRQDEAGAYAAHAYKFSEDCSTFIVECTPKVWTAAGLDRVPVEEGIRRMEKVFADDLEGHELLSNQSRWIQFPHIYCENWHHENVVLLGDALHTAHFSIGSGTKLAMEDSIALAQALDSSTDVESGLRAYEERRKPRVEEYQEAALVSMEWFENFEKDLHLDPLPFAYRVMTRSSKVDHENLRMRDPDFVAACERYEEAHRDA